MKAGRIIRWAAPALLVVVLLLAGVAYFLSLRRPSGYRPAVLSPEQRARARERVEARVMDLLSKAREAATALQEDPEGDHSFTMEVTEEELNEWIASLPDAALAQFRAVGMVDPAASIDEGQLTLYGFAPKHNRVMSVALVPHFDAEGLMTLEIGAVKIGDLPMPGRLLDEELAKLRQHIRTELRKASAVDDDEVFGGVRAKDYRRGAAGLLDALENRPIAIEPPPQFGRVRVVDLVLEEGLATLVVRPIAYEGEPDEPQGDEFSQR